MHPPTSTDWSKPEKEIARRAYRAAYERETAAIAENVRKMASEVSGPPDLWKIHDYLTEKRDETDRKYGYRYSVLLSLFGLLMSEGWVRLEDLAGLSDEKLQEIRRIADFYKGL